MNENPYQPPQASAATVVVRSRSREDLLSVARYQKGILTCIVMYLVALFIPLAFPEEIQALIGIGVLLVGIVGAIFVFLLAIKVYGTGLGIVLGILSLIPFIGFVVLLIVNGGATGVLKRNGIKVGLMGAKLSSI